MQLLPINVAVMPDEAVVPDRKTVGSSMGRWALFVVAVISCFAEVQASAQDPVHTVEKEQLYRVVFGIHERVVLYLPKEYLGIRPAAIDGMLPPIPPSELWPSQ
jgi:hypothetical protein